MMKSPSALVKLVILLSFFSTICTRLNAAKNMHSGRYSWQIKQTKSLVNLKPLKFLKFHILTTDSIDKANTRPLCIFSIFELFDIANSDWFSPETLNLC